MLSAIVFRLLASQANLSHTPLHWYSLPWKAVRINYPTSICPLSQCRAKFIVFFKIIQMGNKTWVTSECPSEIKDYVIHKIWEQFVIKQPHTKLFNNICICYSIYNICVSTNFRLFIFLWCQTGSGKTYTMGTGFDVTVSEDEQGIIPRAVHQLFEGIQRRRTEAQESGLHPPEFKVSAQFLEVRHFTQIAGYLLC